MAGCQQPTLDEDDITYTHTVIAPYLSTRDYPAIMTCLFGDQAAHSLGYKPQGLSERAGLALALHHAQPDKLIGSTCKNRWSSPSIVAATQ